MISDVLRRLEADFSVNPELEEVLLQLSRGFREHGVQLIVQSGELTQGELCWLCVGMPAYRGENKPYFRACIHCLNHDREQASKIGFKMLLPLLDFPYTPRLGESQVTLCERGISQVGKIWSELSALKAWRVRQYAYNFERYQMQGMDFISVWEWAATLDFGPERSQNAWRSFMIEQEPELLAVCDQLSPQRWWKQRA